MSARSIVLVCGLLALPAATHAQELLINGGFETGDFTGWTAFTQATSNGGIFANNIAAGGALPFSGMASSGPATGSWCASVSQGGPGAYSLGQTFTTSAAATSVMVSFSMFHRDSSNSAPLNSGVFDFTSGPAQWARVDILDAMTATSIATIANVGNAGWTNYSLDITSLITPGNSYIFLYRHVDNQLFYHTSLDSASVMQTVIPLPPAAMAGLSTMGVLGGVSAFRRRRAQA